MKDVAIVGKAAAGGAHRALIRRVCAPEPEFQRAVLQMDYVPGWFQDTNAAAFWAVIRDARPRTTVEIGSYLGRSTVFIGQAMRTFSPPGMHLVSIDPHTGDRQQLEGLGLSVMPTLDLFRLHIRGAGLEDIVHVEVATSDDAATRWSEPIDLLFVDGWHSYDAVRSDIRHWATRLAADGLVCFDDFGTYTEVRSAVLDGCSEAGLTLYGSVLAQAWAGRGQKPPPVLGRAIRLSRLRPRHPLD